MKTAKKIFDVFTLVLVVLVLLLAVLLMGVRLFGLEPYVVLSGSMEPKYHVGSLIYVVDVDPAELEVGDPLTFTHSGNIVTHQIVEIKEGNSPANRRFVTQGLTNNVTDGEIPAAAIIGKPVFTIPLLGYVSVFLQTPPGIITAVSLLAIVMLLSFLFKTLSDNKQDAPPSLSPETIPDVPADPDGTLDDSIKAQTNSNKEET